MLLSPQLAQCRFSVFFKKQKKFFASSTKMEEMEEMEMARNKNRMLEFIREKKSVPIANLVDYASKNYFLLHFAETLKQLQESGEILIDSGMVSISNTQAS